MKPSFQKELPIIAIVLLPFIYLAYIWKSLPEKVPVHWNLQGEIDGYGSKIGLVLIILLLPLLTYIIFLVVPYIDPKGKIKNMGNKYRSLKILVIAFTSILALFILYSSKNQSISNPNYIVLLMGILYLIFGNYFKILKPNYFIGIKTPWTLENETVWKETHRIAGKIWFVGGFIIVFGCMVLDKQANFIVFITITGILTIIPIAYSYLKFKQLTK